MTKYSRNTKTYFSNSKIVKSVKHVDGEGQLHGEQKTWWDRNHFYPKELSVYYHGILLRSTTWYLTGQINTNINIANKEKKIICFYTSGKIKFNKNYVFYKGNWLKDGNWTGYYSNGKLYYNEKYIMDKLMFQNRYYSNGILITKKPTDNSDDSDDSETSSDEEIELTQNIFEELGQSNFCKMNIKNI